MPKAARRAVAPKRVKSKTKATKASAVAAAVADKLAGIIPFGEAMLGQNAIDPAYEAIHAARLPLDQQKRLLVVYVLYYHLGSAAYLSHLEGAEFWRVVEVAARNQTSPSATDSALPDGRWPRVADRRHFRGQKCVEAVQELARKFPRPEDLIDWLIAPQPDTDVLTAAVVIKRALTFKQWGPWAAWKFADLAETLGLAPIVFPLDSRLLPEKPREVLIDLGGEATLRKLAAHFSQIPAPPRFVRNCGLQEIETILCRYGSHLNGSTFIGRNIREIRHDLSGGWGPTADLLLEHMPAEVGVGGDHHDQADAAIKVVSLPAIVVAGTMTRAAPVIDTDDDPVALGRDAWVRRKADGRHGWQDWKLIGDALLTLRRQAMALAAARKPSGKNYTRHFSHLLQFHGFDDIDSADRSKLLVLMENEDAVEAYRAALTDAQRAKWNSPSTMWRAWQCRNRGGDFRAQQAGHQQTAAEPTEEFDGEESGAEAEQVSLGRILVDINKLIGVTRDLREFSGEIDDVVLDTLVRQADELATEWPLIAALLRQRQRDQRAA